MVGRGRRNEEGEREEDDGEEEARKGDAPLEQKQRGKKNAAETTTKNKTFSGHVIQTATEN